jgi:gp16 family phage-associated protein
MSNRLLTAQEARNRFYVEGTSVTDWAREHGFPRQAVYSVLSGKSRCTRGRGHRIAVALGMKRSADGITPYPPRVSRQPHEENEPAPHASSSRAVVIGQSANPITAEEMSP